MSGALRRGCFAAALTLILSAQDFTLAKLDLLAKDYTFTEGPAWSKDGFLVFSDIPSDHLLKWVPGHPVETYREHANGPNGNAFDTEGRLYTCESRARRVTRTDKNGKIEVLAEQWEGKRFNAPAHVAVSKNGHVYFTDPAFGEQRDHRELDFYGVYHIPPKGPMKLVARPTGRPNGIAVSPNGKVLYVANSDEHNIRAYDLDKNGDPTAERVFIPAVQGVPGGIAVTESGNLCVAAAGLALYSADGKLLHTIEMHNPPSACAFGEADLQTIIITARSSVFRARFDGKN